MTRMDLITKKRRSSDTLSHRSAAFRPPEAFRMRHHGSHELNHESHESHEFWPTTEGRGITRKRALCWRRSKIKIKIKIKKSSQKYKNSQDSSAKRQQHWECLCH